MTTIELNITDKSWIDNLYTFFKNFELPENILDETQQNLPFVQFTSELSDDKKQITLNLIKKTLPHLSLMGTETPKRHYICEKEAELPVEFAGKPCPTWKDIECQEVYLNNNITAKINCTFGGVDENTISGDRNVATFYNVFVKDVGKNFGEYIKKIQDGKISKDDNTKLFSYLFSILLKLRSNKDLKCYCKMNLDNHNEDVNILHFKFMAPSCSIDSYKRKYLKYKRKYLELKNYSIS